MLAVLTYTIHPYIIFKLINKSNPSTLLGSFRLEEMHIVASTRVARGQQLACLRQKPRALQN